MFGDWRTQSDAGGSGGASAAPSGGETLTEQTLRESLVQIYTDFLDHLPLIVAGVVVLALTGLLAWIARLVAQRVLGRARMRDSLRLLIARFVVIGVWLLGLLLAAMVMFPGLTPSKALAGLGIGSIAVGLAFKDIFENFFAGVLILWRFPFEPGDWIEVKGIEGRVIDVTVRNTVLRTVRGELVVIPNADLYKNPVDVLTNRDLRRIEEVCGVAYGEDVDAARDVIEEAVSSCESVSGAHEVQVFVRGFNTSSIDFEVAWWTGSTPLDRRRSRDEVLSSVKRALDDAGIEIPFPQRSVWFRSGLDVSKVDGDGGA